MNESVTFAKDPMCGMSVDVATALHYQRDGETYYFCSDPCQRKFQSVSEGESRTCCG